MSIERDVKSFSSVLVEDQSFLCSCKELQFIVIFLLFLLNKLEFFTEIIMICCCVLRLLTI